MQTEEESSGSPKGLLLGLGVIGIVVAAAIAGEFVLNLQPQISGPTVSVQAGVASILIPPNAVVANFDPVSVIVVIGVNNTISWTNQDSIAHTVYSSKVPPGASPFHSQVLNKGDTYEVTLNVTGAYDYYCNIHPATMRASIVVKSGATVVIPAGTAARSLNYSPSQFTVEIGVNNTVTFVNQDSATHTVTSNTGAFDSGDIASGKSWTHTFTTPGTYSFHCKYHSFMTGTVTVVSS